MCLIIASHIGELPPDELVQDAFLDNKDGWGIVYGQSLSLQKGMDLVGAQRAIKEAKGQPYVMHFRWATHGKVNLENNHPYRVGKRAYMAHNGVLGVDIKNPDFSDTWHLARVLEELGFCPDWTTNQQWVKDMEEYIGAGNKLAFLTCQGLSLVNEKAGKWHGGYWLSNEHSCWSGGRWPKQWWKVDATKKTRTSLYEECDYCQMPSYDLLEVTGGVRLCYDCHQWHMLEEMEDQKHYGPIIG